MSLGLLNPQSTAHTHLLLPAVLKLHPISGPTRAVTSPPCFLFNPSGNVRAATFVYVLYQMLDHKLVPQAEKLDGMYLQGFLKIAGMIEDSGWKLKKEGDEEEEEEEELDDDLLQPPAGYGYSQSQ